MSVIPFQLLTRGMTSYLFPEGNFDRDWKVRFYTGIWMSIPVISAPQQPAVALSVMTLCVTCLLLQFSVAFLTSYLLTVEEFKHFCSGTTQEAFFSPEPLSLVTPRGF